MRLRKQSNSQNTSEAQYFQRCLQRWIAVKQQSSLVNNSETLANNSHSKSYTNTSTLSMSSVKFDFDEQSDKLYSPSSSLVVTT